ncbi:ligand-dependent nuclear receptor-interacting factor 1 [Monodelphis domestica]|uniref:Ligand dependent nuclear receptor interacting factor 1 n=1 Tax=Monodelphis domestica TaxID=13616 RepID=F7BX50_MONDO|nr:ligand-dependent nuclear receptor-interacting factor 1 [Monodelphis domestica]
MSNLPRVVLKPPEDVSGSAAPPCIAGCMYQVVQTTGLDGKNLLKLLPIPNSSGNLMPLVQSSVTSDTSNGNISNPVHVTIQTQLASSPANASIQFPVFQTTNSGNYILSRAVDKSENVRVASVGKESLTSSCSTVQNNAMKVERLALQKIAVSPATPQSDTTYMLVNTKNLPVTVKSPVLPYGHHLQIPANAEVKSVPASSLPPPIQQKILAAAATNTSGTTEASKVPTVIYVSPVNTVKSVVSKTYKNICPKPPNPTEPAKSMVLNTSQTSVKNPGTDVSNNEGQQSRDAPMKWVVRENPQSTPCLVPVKSSNNMASKILKTLMDMKNVETGSLNMSSLCSSTSSGTQAKITPIKDNALVMFNGKVYLLAKKGSEVLPSQTDQQNSAAPDASPRKDTSQISNSSSITNEVVNIVLAKNKTAPQKETKLLSDTQLASEPAPNLEKNNKVECASLSALNPQHAKQPISHVEQCNTVPIKLNLPDVISPVQNAIKETSINHTKEAGSADDPTITSQHCVPTHQEPKNQGEMALVLETHFQSRSQKESCRREYAELRKKFGITKDLKVNLTRILAFDSTTSLYSPSSLTNSVSSKESEIIVDLTTGNDEESQELILQQDLDKKRKAKTVIMEDNTKKKKSGNDGSTSGLIGTDSTSPQILNSISPDSALSLHSSNLIGYTKFSEENSSELELPNQDGLDRSTDSPASASFEQDPPDSQDCYIDDSFPTTLPELDETIRDEKIKRLKQLLKEREAALEEIRKKMQQS